MKTEVARYLGEREQESDWFDSTVMVARKYIKRLYALIHKKPSERAQQILFDRKPPEDSRIYAIQQLSKATTPAEQARLIMELKVPYRVASTVISQMTPTILLALIESMSDQELMNNLGSLKKRGAFNNPELKTKIEEKLGKAKKGKRVSGLKAAEVIKATDLSEETKKQLEEIADTQMKAKGRIKVPTALFIDKSGSMSVAIELGKQIGALISAICEQGLYTYAFDGMAYPIEVQSNNLADWEKALKGISAGGSTSVGAPIEFLRRKKQLVEQMIVVTDEDENAPPAFTASYRS